MKECIWLAYWSWGLELWDYTIYPSSSKSCGNEVLAYAEESEMIKGGQ